MPETSITIIWALFLGSLVLLFLGIGYIAIIIYNQKRFISLQNKDLATLRKIEKRYSDLFNNVSDLMFIHSLSGKILLTNAAVKRLLGYEVHELVGKSIKFLYDPKYHPQVDKYLETIGNQDEIAGRMSVKGKSGNTYILEYRNSLITQNARPIGVRGVARNVTEQLKTEQALKESEQRFRRLVKYSPFPILVDLGGTLVYVNDSGIKLFAARNTGEVIGKTIENFIHPEFRMMVENEFSRSQSEQDPHPVLEVKIIRCDGEIRDVEFVTIPTVYLKHPARQIVFRDITERKQAEEEVKVLAHAIRGISDCVSICDLSNNILFVNEAFTKTYGYTREELIGKNIRLTRSPRNDHQILADIHSSTLRGGWRGELWNRRKDGGEFPVLISTSVVRDDLEKPFAVIEVSSDITERKRVEKTIRESEDRYRSLVESTPEAIMVEQDGKVVFVNPAALNLLGYATIQELSQMSFKEIFDTKSGNPVSTFLKLKGKGTLPTLLDGKLIRKDGNLIDAGVTFIHTTFQGGPALLLLAQDITETKNLRQAAQRMEQLAALGQLSASIAHEIRNPLAAISLNIQLISEQLDIPPDFKDTINDMSIGVQRIQDIIRGILSFARPAKLTAKKVDLHYILDSSIRAVENEFQKTNIQIFKKYGKFSSEILIDANQIIEVFINLFTNAKDAMQKGGSLTIRTNRFHDHLEVTVEDTGKGISSENLEKVFNPFFTTKTKGMGLGLAIVYRIIEQHQGKILVESEVDKGTRFRIQFPLG